MARIVLLFSYPSTANCLVAGIPAAARAAHQILQGEGDAPDNPCEIAVPGGWTPSETTLSELKRLLQRVPKTIHQQPDFVRYAMNGFVIALGTYVPPLTDLAVCAAEKIGPVSVDMGNTTCQVPNAVEYILKVRQRGTIGKKRRTAKC